MPRSALVCILLAGLAGCAVRRAGPDLSNPGPVAVRWRLPAQIIDGATGATLTEAAVVDRLLAARVIYVAEKHDGPHHHAVQAWVLDAVHRRDPSVGVGLEMIKRPFQKWLTDYGQGRIDEAEFVRRTEWTTRWGFDIALYRPILEIARSNRLPLYALNARDEITRAVAREGLDALDPVDRGAIPQLDLEVTEHRDEIREIFESHGGGHGKMTFENFYTAQVIWDETMAYEVARELSASDAPHRIIVLAGSGHIRRGLGIPARAARRGAKPFITVYPVIVEDDDEVQDLLTAKVADILWVMRRD